MQDECETMYFECFFMFSTTFTRHFSLQNQIIQHNQRAGVIVSSGDLALQGVTRHQAGNYTCTASNVEGDGDSNVVELRVMCKRNIRQITTLICSNKFSLFNFNVFYPTVLSVNRV